MFLSHHTMKRILVLGGGFAGVECCLQLESYFKNNPDVEIVLVGEDNFVLFTPMLPQVASGTIETRHIVTPIRTLIKKTKFYEDKIKTIDPQQKIVSLYGTHEKRGKRIHYDYLVVALGSKPNFFGMKDVEQNAYTMTTINDAILLRNRIIDLMEQAENETDVTLRKNLLHVAVVGGGFAGIETAGEINDFIADIAEYYPTINRHDVKISLIEATPKILIGFSPKLAAFAKNKLVDRGITIFLNAAVTSYDGKELTLKSTSKSNTILVTDSDHKHPNYDVQKIDSLESNTVIWTAGIGTNEILQDSLFPTPKGRIRVNKFLQIPEFPNVFAIGDCAVIDPELTEKKFPPTAQVAEAHAKTAANNLMRLLGGQEMSPFDYSWKGQSAIIGKRTGIASFFGMPVSGFIAFTLWRNLYLSKIRGWNKRLRIWIDWNLDLFFKRDISRLKTMKKISTDFKELDEVDDVW